MNRPPDIVEVLSMKHLNLHRSSRVAALSLSHSLWGRNGGLKAWKASLDHLNLVGIVKPLLRGPGVFKGSVTLSRCVDHGRWAKRSSQTTSCEHQLDGPPVWIPNVKLANMLGYSWSTPDTATYFDVQHI